MSRNRLYILVLILSFAGYILIFLTVNRPESLSSSRTVCLFKNISGIPCPACGTTRSISTIVQGNFKEALLLNPLGYLASSLLLIFPVLVIKDMFSKRDNFFRFYQKFELLLSNWWVSSILILAVTANWIWNITKEL